MSNGTRIIRAPRGAGTIRCTARLHADGHRVATGAPVPRAGAQNTFDIRAFVPEHVRPLYCGGIGPFGWAALSGDPDDIALTHAAARVRCSQARLVIPVGSGDHDRPGPPRYRIVASPNREAARMRDDSDDAVTRSGRRPGMPPAFRSTANAE